MREVFQRTEEHLARVQVSETSVLTGKTVNDLDLAAKVGADIIAVRRGKHWRINPEKEIVIPEDILLALGTAMGLKSLVKAARGEVDKIS